MNKIVYKDKTYQGKTLHEVDAYIGDALVSDALTVDTMTAVVKDEPQATMLLAADGLLAYSGGLLATKTGIATLDKRGVYGEPVWQYRDAAVFGKFYLDNIKRIGKNIYELNTISAVGLLVKDKHFGGVYSGETAANIIADVIGGRVSYTLDPALADIPVYGWLPIASRRDNLRDVLFAIGGQIRKDSVGELNIIPMESKEAYEISADEIYRGGSVAGGVPATEIQVTEHQYAKLATDPTETLFEGEAAGTTIKTPQGQSVSGVMVEFDAPYYDLAVQNASIIESGVNYAVISSSPSALLTGRKYAHIERLVIRENNTNSEPNVLTSKQCGLVSLVNSELVAERLMAYYGSGKTIETDFVVTDQKPGDMVRLIDPFGDVAEGFIADMELTVSNKMRARASIISGFIPAAYGNYYSAVDVITADGTYTVRAECKGKIRIVLIDGGTGGAAGEAGENGQDGGARVNGKGGAGGKGGKGGAAGKIYVITLIAAPGETYAVKIGAGGKGAQFGGTATEGGATTFGVYSSALGYTPDIGYSALLTNVVYAQNGENGVDGGRGLDGEETDTVTVEFGGETWESGTTGIFASGGDAAAAGGGGGGAAVGANGGDGEDGFVSIDVNDNYLATGGDGGAGATPIAAPNAQIPGSGGHGGHGGGGGGGGGGKRDSVSDFFAGNGGEGGEGGAGGDGAPGIILVYY